MGVCYVMFHFPNMGGTVVHDLYVITCPIVEYTTQDVYMNS